MSNKDKWDELSSEEKEDWITRQMSGVHLYHSKKQTDKHPKSKEKLHHVDDIEQLLANVYSIKIDGQLCPYTYTGTQICNLIRECERGAASQQTIDIIDLFYKELPHISNAFQQKIQKEEGYANVVDKTVKKYEYMKKIATKSDNYGYSDYLNKQKAPKRSKDPNVLFKAHKNRSRAKSLKYIEKLMYKGKEYHKIDTGSNIVLEPIIPSPDRRETLIFTYEAWIRETEIIFSSAKIPD